MPRMTRQERGQKFLDAFIAEFSEKKTLVWQEMMPIALSTGLKVTDWMEVRGVVQFMKNKKMIERTSNLHEERYNWIRK